jgi:plasmid maintenance system antidote protein VapI
MTIAQQIKALKGIHPGIFLGRELKKQKRSLEDIAMAIGEHPQILEEITLGKRTLNKRLAKKIEHELQINNGLLNTLQLHYKIKKSKLRHGRREHTARPDISKFRKSLFWDTRLESIHWNKQKLAVIKRIFERGNEQEKQEIIRFYGPKVIAQALPHALIRS